MSRYHDTEELRGFSDGDFEMRELTAAADRASALRAAGQCPHSSGHGYNADALCRNLKPGQWRCTDVCGVVFESEAAFDQAHLDARGDS